MITNEGKVRMAYSIYMCGYRIFKEGDDGNQGGSNLGDEAEGRHI